MVLFGRLHLALLILIAAVAMIASLLCRRGIGSTRVLRLGIGYGLGVNELVWWAFRYSHEGFRFPANLPLQLCDITLWMTVIACITLARFAVEFSYFGGMAGAGMALLTPDLWSPCPTYPAIYFFIAHGLIVVGASALVFGRIAPLEPGAVWRAFRVLLFYTIAVGCFNQIFGTNYMYLCRKPANASLLDALGPWPAYVVAGGLVGLGLFWLLWLPARPRMRASAAAAAIR